MQDLLAKYDNTGSTVTVRELDPIGNGNYRSQLRRVKLSNDMNVIIACSVDILPEVFKQAQQVGLLTDEHQFIITSLDMHTIDLEPFQHGGTTIIGVRMISPEDAFVKEITEFFAEKYKKNKNLKKKSRNDDDNDEEDENNEDEDEDDDGEDEENEDNEDENEEESNNENDDENADNENEDKEDEDEIPEGLTPEKINLDTALTFDAVLLFSEIIKFDDMVQSKSIKCDDDSQIRIHGISDIMAMKTVDKRKVKGLTGNLHFDQKGHRADFLVDIIELASDGIQKIGVWNSSDSQVYMLRSEASADALADDSMRNKTFVVLTALVSFL